MKRNWRGFTLVEVALFLAITAAIFVGVTVGTQNSIFQQRYNDAVQNFAEFLRSVYSQVTNVQNDGNGRSDKAIYGKLVVFSEEDNKNNILTYNVIGDANSEKCSSGDVLAKLNCLNANVNYKGEPTGFVEDYTPRWASQIQTPDGWDANGLPGYSLFRGLLLVVRHPSSGTVYTYIYQTDGSIDTTNPLGIGMSDDNNMLINGFFDQHDVDFCVNPNGAEKSNLRRDVRIVDRARNASGVEVIGDEARVENSFNGRPVKMGNRCE